MTIFSMCSFLRYWAGMYDTEEGDKIRNGVDQLMAKAWDLTSFMGSAASSSSATVSVPGQLLITEG